MRRQRSSSKRERRPSKPAPRARIPSNVEALASTGPRAEPAKTSAELIGRIVAKRIDNLDRHAFNVNPRFDYRHRLTVGTPPQTLLAKARKIRSREDAVGKLMDALQRTLIPEMIAICPSLTAKDLIAALRQAWPATRGQRVAATMFDSGLIRAAHAAVQQEHGPGAGDWTRLAAAEELADRLAVDVRTIKNYLRRTSPGKNL